MDLQEHIDREIQREKEKTRRKLIYAFSMLALVYFAAITAFHLLESWSWEDSVYFTTSTITTVGYGDLTPHSYYGRLFTIPLMWIGIAVGLYFIYTIQDYGRSKMEQRMGTIIDQVDGIRGKNGKKK
ncbi:MAG: potassium channel family protein [Candidatus Micrarchaeota archaeon]|nr:potassium channel family protein [Candidatus Micrarchaeota archaeon]